MNIEHIPRSVPQFLRDALEDTVVRIQPKDVVRRMIYKYPDQDQCRDRLNGNTAPHGVVHTELELAAKLALMAYALPYFMRDLSTHFHLPNRAFTQYCATLAAIGTLRAYENMDEILKGDQVMIPLPPNHQIAGMYIRTPIRIYTQSGKRIHQLPPLEKIYETLTQHRVEGNVNVWVLRYNHPSADTFECYVLFRGTSNPFNAVHQYGQNFQQTQIFAWPDYDPVTKTRTPEGSDTIPLCQQHYMNLLEDVRPHLLEALHLLNADSEKCTRVVVSGHSMGGAMVMAFAYMLRSTEHPLWEKSVFRSFAAPLWCNDAAVLQLEQWFVDSLQPNKFFEVLNTDDFINLQYHLAGRSGVEESLQKGGEELLAWLLPLLQKSSATNPMADRIRRILQIYPEVALAVFTRGVLRSQLNAEPNPDLRLGVRMGHRREENQSWGTGELKSVFNGTVRLFHCERGGDVMNEFLGKSHAHYGNVNINVLWAPLVNYEQNLYKKYQKQKEFRKQLNRPIFVGAFGSHDAPAVVRWIEDHTST
jgi:hypothetical protein